MTTTALLSPATAAHPRWDEDITPLNLRRGLGAFPTGAVAVTGRSGGVDEVMVSSSFAVGVSWEPALVSFAAQKSSRTWPRLRSADTLGISLLAEDQHRLCRQLSSRSGDRLAGVDLHRTDRRTPLLEGSSVWLETRLHAEVDAGDHTVVLLEVLGFADHTDVHAPAALHHNAFAGLRPLA